MTMRYGLVALGFFFLNKCDLYVYVKSYENVLLIQKLALLCGKVV